MAKQKNKDKNEPKIWDTLKSDFNQINLHKDIRLDFKDTIDFYLSDDQKLRLNQLKWYKKLFILPAWLLKRLFQKLNPLRRIMFTLSLVLLLLSRSSLNLYGILILIFLLILELKDKLIAADELKAGHAVQKAFMPPDSPDLKGWDIWLYSKPANIVGGDLIDFLALDAIRFGITLGDISGKELGAALYMVKLQSTIRTLAFDFESLSKLGEKVNSIFYRDSESSRFATLVYLELSSDSGKIKLLNAGHMPPLIIRENEIDTLPKGSIALGIVPKACFREDSVTINEGEIMVIFSDGVTETINEKGEFFGTDRLKNILAECRNLKVAEIGQKILSAAESFKGREKIHDDLSLAILKKK